jgi:hypothetical protein
MLKMLERNIATVDRHLVMLAPPYANVPDSFTNVSMDSAEHENLVREMQCLRAKVYLSEGNVKESQLSSDGRHQTPEDEKSWHLLMVDRTGHVSSCAWYLEHENTTSMQNLRVRYSPLAKLEGWGDKLRGAVESELARARREGMRYAEVGGWAVAKERRRSCEALMLALATYGLCRSLGGALVMTTANVTHGSSAILRRLGGSYLAFEGEQMPTYFDPKYNTNIELLRFDSRHPNGKYSGLIDMLNDKLAHVPVVAYPSESDRRAPYFPRVAGAPAQSYGALQPWAAA